MSHSSILKIYYFYTYKVALAKKLNCVHPKFICWPPNPSVRVSGDGAFGKDLLRVRRSWVWSPNNGIIAFVRRDARKPVVWVCVCVCVCLSVCSVSPSPTYVKTQQEGRSTSREECPCWKPTCWHVDSQPPDPWERKRLLLKPSSLWYFVWEPELTKTSCHTQVNEMVKTSQIL